MTELDHLHAALDASAAAGGVPVLATLAAVHEGSTFRAAGARMIVRPDGTTVGAISGGCLERDLAEHAAAARAAGEPRRVPYDLMRDDDAPWGLGMGCAARLTVLLEPCPAGAPSWLTDAREAHARREPIVLRVADATTLAGTEPPAVEARRTGRSVLADDVLFDLLPPPVAVRACGDGPDAIALVRLAGALGWNALQLGRDVALDVSDARAAVVLMSHAFAIDRERLREALRSGCGYIGVLGPARRTQRLLAELGVAERPARLHAPVGLDIGAETPEEIALATLAEIRAALTGRPGAPLRDRPGPIHGR